VTYSAGNSLRGTSQTFAVDFSQERVEVAARKSPLEGRSCLFIAGLEVEETLFQFGQRGEVVGREHLSLNDGEVDFDLVEPTGVNRGVDENSVGPSGAEAINGFLSPVGGAVVHNPEDAMSRLVRLLAHDLSEEAVRWGNSIFRFAAAEEFGAMDVPSCQIGPGALAEILVLDSPGAVRSQRQTPMFSAAGLDAGLFICREDEFIASQWGALPRALIQVEDDTRLDSKLRIAGENPTSMSPRTEGIPAEPAPQCSAADLGHQTLSEDVLADLRDRKSRQGETEVMRKLAGEGLNLNDETGGKSGPSARPEAAPPGPGAGPDRTACAIC